jgi:hypothetical protein
MMRADHFFQEVYIRKGCLVESIIRKTDGSRDGYSRIISAYEFSLLPCESERHLKSHIWLDKWTDTCPSSEAVWSCPRSPRIFEGIDTEREFSHADVFWKERDPFAIISCGDAVSSHCERKYRTSTTVPVRMTHPSIDHTIEYSYIIICSAVSETDIFSFEPEYFYISETVATTGSHITRGLACWQVGIRFVYPSEEKSFFGERIIEVELWR